MFDLQEIMKMSVEQQIIQGILAGLIVFTFLFFLPTILYWFYSKLYEVKDKK